MNRLKSNILFKKLLWTFQMFGDKVKHLIGGYVGIERQDDGAGEVTQ